MLNRSFVGGRAVVGREHPRQSYRSLIVASLVFSSLGFVTNFAAASDPPDTPPVLLQMIRDQSIHEELKLTDEQRQAILAVLPEIDGPWFRSRNLAPPEQRAEVGRLTKTLEKHLAKTLSRPQIERIKELRRQALGTRMFVRSDVVKRLGLTEQQQAELNSAFAQSDERAAEIQQQLRAGTIDSVAGHRKTQQLKQQEQQSVATVLTVAQKQKISSMIGKPFDFSLVQRMYPLAPELVDEGVQWIQGGPIRLAELRGKVVAVHFYAYRCINCIRNLPHYQGWDEDFSDDDFVVIGIQTPELPAERNFDRVAEAAKSAGIQYPVMLDAESSNWKNWHNTMWPTVYLIDKQGYLRRWWQGELNWKGATGEEELRGLIEQLIAE